MRLLGESILNAIREAVSAAQDSMPDETPSPCERCPELEKDPNKESKATGNEVKIVFDPDKSEKVSKCKKIVHVQFARRIADGKVMKTGEYYAGYKFKDKVTTADGWYVDHLKTEKTPDYQQGVGNGKKNGGVGKATITDAPSTSGGDKGFYDPKTNPKGWKSAGNEFAAFAWCMDGDDCGKWYEGVTWEYTKSWEDQRDGKDGTSKITNNNVTTAPSKSQLEAFNKFNQEKGFKPCKP